MHILTLEARVEIGPEDIFPPGEYLAPDAVAAQFLLLGDGGQMRPAEQHERWLEKFFTAHTTGDWNGRSLLIQRAGGFGDLILLTPVLRELKRRWPSLKIGLSTMNHYAVAVSNLPYIDEIVPFPTPIAQAEKFDGWVFLENTVEKNPRAKEVHMTELFGEVMGVEGIGNLLPEYRVKPSEAVWAQEAYPRKGPRRVAIHVSASTRCRRYPKMGEVARELIDRGVEVMLIGAAGEIPKFKDELPPLLRDLTRAGLTFRQTCAVVNICDSLIGADSAFLHVAGALAVPAVGLYGPFPWKLRTAHCPTTFAMAGSGSCAPCFHHNRATMQHHFPEHCPSAQRGVCQVLEGIKPERIAMKAEKIMRDIAPPLEGVKVG